MSNSHIVATGGGGNIRCFDSSINGMKERYTISFFVTLVQCLKFKLKHGKTFDHMVSAMQ